MHARSPPPARVKRAGPEGTGYPAFPQRYIIGQKNNKAPSDGPTSYPPGRLCSAVLSRIGAWCARPGRWLAELWRFREIRAVIIQVVVVSVAFAVAAFFVRNVVVNLNALGKDFSFSFLFAPAAYDITFSPFLDYTSRDTHLEAALVGILNTGLVAAASIVTATVLGVGLGLARLSGNWLADRIAYVGLEFGRNVPLLLHILLVHGIIVTALPGPRQAHELAGAVFISNRGLYVPGPVVEPGMGLVSGVLAAALAGCWLFRRWARAYQARTGRTVPVGFISLGVVVASVLGAFALAGMPLRWEVPALAGFNFRGGLAIKPEFLALWVALTYYTGSFIAENVRGGVLAIDPGQAEAARALGLRYGRTLRLVVVPQTLPLIIPPLVNQYLNLTKNSSLAIAIGYMDIVATIGGISLMQTGREVETMIIVLGLYLGFSLTISVFMNRFNRRVLIRQY